MAYDPAYDPLGFGAPRGSSTVSNPTTANPTNTSTAPAGSTPAAGPYTIPGIQPGRSLEHVEGLELSKRGPAEQQWIDSRSAYNTPSFGEVNNQGLVGYYSNASNRPQLTNNSQDWFSQYSGQMPNLMSDPGLGPYFDNAKARAAESINAAAGARGNYGSSSAIDQNARAFTDLEGQRALKEADYALQRAQEDRMWQELGGRLAGSADTTSAGISAEERNWADLLSRLGYESSELGLKRTNSAMDAAIGAQGAERTRGQDFFNNEAAAGDRQSDQILRVLLQALGADMEFVEQLLGAPVAAGNAEVANENANAATTTDAAKTAFAFAQ